MPPRETTTQLDAQILRALETNTPEEVASTLSLPLSRVYAARRRHPTAPRQGQSRRPREIPARDFKIESLDAGGYSTEQINQRLNTNLSRQRIHQIVKRVQKHKALP